MSYLEPNLLAIGTTNQEIVTYRVEDAELIEESKVAHSDTIVDIVAVTSQYVVSGAWNGEVLLWSKQSGTIQAAHHLQTGGLRNLSVDKEKNLLSISSDQDGILILDINKWLESKTH